MSLVRRPKSAELAASGLHPLPAGPRTKWPEDTPLPVRIAESALWHGCGNVARAAELLGTDIARLGYLISRTPELQDARRKASELILDQAEYALTDSLGDPDTALDSAKWILSNGGRGRGWGKEAQTTLGFAFGGDLPGGGQIAIKWQVSEEPT